MDLTELQNRCVTRFQDPNLAIVDCAGWKDYLNDAYRDVMAANQLWPFLRGTASNIVVNAGSRSVDLPLDVWRVSAVFNLTDAWRMRSISGSEAALIQSPDQTETGPPIAYRVFGNALEVFPLPTANTTFKVDFFQPPADLSAGADLPVFPRQYHNILVEGALARAYIDDGQSAQAADYQKAFDATLIRLVADLLSGQQSKAPQVVDDWWD